MINHVLLLILLVSVFFGLYPVFASVKSVLSPLVEVPRSCFWFRLFCAPQLSASRGPAGWFFSQLLPVFSSRFHDCIGTVKLFWNESQKVFTDSQLVLSVLSLHVLSSFLPQSHRRQPLNPLVSTSGKGSHQAEEGVLSGLFGQWDSGSSWWVPTGQAERSL